MSLFELSCDIYTNENSTQLRTINLNGMLEGKGIGAGSLQLAEASFTVGGSSVGDHVVTLDSYYTDCIDQLTISGRVKTACEIELIANLA